MNVAIWFGNLSRRVIRLFSYTGNNLIHYSKVEFGGGVSVMNENQKPVWIKRDGVDVGVVISPELFEELVSAQEELEDIAKVDEAMKDKSPGIPWEQVQKELTKDTSLGMITLSLDAKLLQEVTVVAEKSTGAAQAEGKFLRAFFATQVMDIYGQVPYRAAADGPDVIPAVKTRSEAFDWIMTDLDAAIAALPHDEMARVGRDTELAQGAIPKSSATRRCKRIDIKCRAF